MKMITKKNAKIILDANKDNTCYFSKETRPYKLAGSDIYNHLRYVGFGEAEANVIVASLILCGAKLEEG